MAFAVRQPAAAVSSEENAVAVRAAVKGQSLLQQAVKKRAPLTDVSNVGARAPAASNAAATKSGADPVKLRASALPRPGSKDADPAAMPAPGVAPSRPQSAAAQPAAQPVLARTRSQTRQAKNGQSMSALLQSRSEAAVAPSKPTPVQSAEVQAPPSPLPDIDSQNSANPLAEPEYAADIYSYYHRVESKFRVKPNYMQLVQTDINEKMRAILIDWLVEVHLKFKLMPESLYLTVNLIDRFLEVKQVTKKNLQLVGVAAMLIASKYEEIWAPEVRDFVYISDKAYTREEILGMEKLMLNTLQFNLTLPTTHNFLARYMQAAGQSNDAQVLQLATYLTELAMVDASMLVHGYSMISAASLYVALRTLGRTDTFPHTMARHAGYSRQDVLPCAAMLVKLMQRAPTHTLNAVYKKYCKEKFLAVATLAPAADLLLEASELQQQAHA